MNKFKIMFRQKTDVHSVGVYTDYKADESYTPSKLSVRVGNDFNDLHEIEVSWQRLTR